MGSVQRRLYPDAFKRESVERVGSSGLPVGKVAAELGIHEAILRRWVRQLSPAAATPAVVQPRAQAITPATVAGGAGSRESPSAPGERAAKNGARDSKKNRDDLRSGNGGKMRFHFVDRQRDVWPVQLMCEVLGLSTSGYYAWARREESKRGAADRQLLGEIETIYNNSSGTYGSPRVHAALRRTGRQVGRSRMQQLRGSCATQDCVVRLRCRAGFAQATIG